MDEFDFKEEAPRKRSGFGAAIWNCATLFFFLAALVLGVFFLVLFLNPKSEFNPLPPASQVESTSVPVATEVVSPQPTETPTSTPDIPTATPTEDQPGGFFGIQNGSPAALDSTVFHPEAGCEFMGVAGQAFDLNGAPITGLQVHISGSLGDQPMDKLAVTGAATQFGAGAYYEIQLADRPVASVNTLQIALLDGNGAPVSNLYTFSTTDSCQANLIFVNFAEQ